MITEWKKHGNKKEKDKLLKSEKDFKEEEEYRRAKTFPLPNPYEMYLEVVEYLQSSTTETFEEFLNNKN
jgi:hypothetical protein